MKIEEHQALEAFAALSQETRLKMVRVLVVAGEQGMAAGTVGEKVGVAPSSASFHLANLERAGLITSRREARSIIYTAHYAGLAGLVDFLMNDCCQGHLNLGEEADKTADPCCSPAETA